MMKAASLSLVFVLLVMPLLAQDAAPSPASTDEMAMKAGKVVELKSAMAELATDIHALQRIVNVTEELKPHRSIVLAIVDEDIEALRGPVGDGTYAWAALQREESGRASEEAAIETVSTEKDLKSVSVSASRAFRVVITVPKKRNAVWGNNRVFVRNIVVDWTSMQGQTTRNEFPVNVWINPEDSHGVALPEIAKSAKATAELGVETGSKKAVAEIALVQAKLVDDPQGPNFPAVRRLLNIRRIAADDPIRRAELKSAIDETVLSMPGEMDKRIQEQLAAVESRRLSALSWTPKGSIALGDATPDVVSSLAAIQTLLAGTVEQQSEGREKLRALLESLQPKVEPKP